MKLANNSFVTSSVLRPLKRSLDELRHAPAGERFQRWHRKKERTARPWARPLYLVGAVVCLAIGVVLAVMPGPAVLFFALAGGLLAAQSATVARFLDATE